ncbi:MAG TPA: alkaline phosphatase family protein [Bryobacteraceae bacterium]|nr:alkaline phosphatase family protein [Bryobacteraceae bacterium]
MTGSRIALALFLFLHAAASAQVKRIVVIKLDGVPQALLDQELRRIDPATNKSALPWIDRVFAQQGVRLVNFYVRAISLSAPSWSLLDTGQHLQIHGNAEFDRYTNHVYDYLNFFPFYVGYSLSRRVDMPGVEVLDDLGIPLLIDRFPYQETYQSFQLFQRGVRWRTLQNSLQHHFTSRSLRDLLDEWTIGFEIGSSVEEQTERELIAKLADPRIRYLDFFTGDYDHVAHGTPDSAAQRQALQRIDALIGRIWTAIEASPQAGQTVLAVVSDHGMNTQPGVYSQGYDLVQFFNSREGGAHHVATNRHPRTEYKLKGLDPFVSEVVTPSEESFYLKGESGRYPTALLDLDGNERAAVYLRNSDLNALHILLDEISRPSPRPEVRRAVIAAFFQIVDRHRAEWQSTVAQLREELAALGRTLEARRLEIASQPKKWTTAQRDQGLDRTSRRLGIQLDAWRDQQRSYSDYEGAVNKLLAVTPSDFDKHPPSVSDLIPRHAMGDSGTIHDLENYIVGPAKGGLVLAPDGSLDLDRSFRKLNYLPRLAALAVKNSVQANVGSHPVDFIAVRVPRQSLTQTCPPDDLPYEDAIWLYGDENHQILILSRHDPNRGLELRQLAVQGLQQDAEGDLHSGPANLIPGLPLRIFEDPELAVPESDRSAWLNSWHSELDWLHATHRTRYSNAILALHEQFLEDAQPSGETDDAGLIRRFQARRRLLAEPDFLIFANDHWNFNVRGFNPGGNHGSLLRISTNSVLMLAGGAETGIPHQLVIDEPYDSLSFAPTVIELMGLPRSTPPLPGRLIRELLTTTEKAGGRP